MVLCAAALLSAPATLERVVAVIGSEPVLHSEVISLVVKSDIDQEAAYEIDTASQSYQLAMEQLIEEKLLVEAARRDGIYPERQEIEDAVDQAMAEARSEFASEQEFLNYLASMGMTVSSLRGSYTSMMGDRLASENYVRVKAGTAMTAMPSDAVSFMNENMDLVEEVLAPANISWIYLPVLPENTQEAEDFLSDLRVRIEAGEIAFSAAAAEYSQDGSASSGGDLGWFGRGDMTAVFERMAYSLEPGEIGGPFLTPFGVHLMKLTDKNEEQVRASHIIIVSSPLPEDLDRTVAQAESIITEINNGAEFVEEEHRYSCDPDPGNVDGFLGTVNTGAWVGDMRRAVSDLSPGELSRPVVVEQNMAVVVFKKCEDQTINWNDFTADELNSMLRSVYWQKYYSGMIESLRDDIPVVINLQ
jgi:parvulin-like peptidyl-prolyl isomerase